MANLADITPFYGVPTSVRMSHVRHRSTNVNIAWSKGIPNSGGKKELVCADILVRTLKAYADHVPALEADKWRVILHYNIGHGVEFETIVETYWKTMALVRALINKGDMEGARLFVVIRMSATGDSEFMRCFFGNNTKRPSSQAACAPPLVRISHPRLETIIEDEVDARYDCGVDNVRHPPHEKRTKKMRRYANNK